MEERTYFGNITEAELRRTEALKSIEKMSEEARQKVLDDSRTTNAEEARENMPIDQWLIMDILCSNVVKKTMSVLNTSEIEELKVKLIDKMKSGTMTMFEQAMFNNICIEYGFTMPKTK